MKIVYNPKLDYLICKWLCNPRKNHDEMRLRSVYEGKRRSKTKDQLTIQLLREAQNLLKNQAYTLAYSTITKKHISTELKTFLTIMHQSDFEEVKTAVELFGYETYHMDELNFIALFYNQLRMNHGLVPLFYQIRYLNDIHKYSRSKDIYIVEQLIHVLKLVSHRMNRLSKKTNLEKIAFQLNKKKEEIFKKFHITEVYAYGSFARNSLSKYSDLDLVVVINQKTFEESDVLVIQSAIEEIVGIKADIHVCLQKLDLSMFDKYIKRDLKKII